MLRYISGYFRSGSLIAFHCDHGPASQVAKRCVVSRVSVLLATGHADSPWSSQQSVAPTGGRTGCAHAHYFIAFHLTTLPQLQTLFNAEWEGKTIKNSIHVRIWKEAFLWYYRIQSHHFTRDSGRSQLALPGFESSTCCTSLYQPAWWPWRYAVILGT